MEEITSKIFDKIEGIKDNVTSVHNEMHKMKEDVGKKLANIDKEVSLINLNLKYFENHANKTAKKVETIQRVVIFLIISGGAGAGGFHASKLLGLF